jgi:hypothetical protein
MNALKSNSTPALFAAALLTLLFACHLGEPETDGEVFSFPSLDESIAGADSATILLLDTNGITEDTLFHGEVNPSTRFMKLDAPGYGGGLAVLSIVAKKDGEILFKEERWYDGKLGEVVVTKSIVLPNSSVDIIWPNPAMTMGENTPFPEVSIQPSALADKSVQWMSRDESILRVGPEGLSASGAGPVHLVAILRSDTSKRDSVRVEVKPRGDGTVPLDSLRIRPDSLRLALRGPHGRLKVHLYPAGTLADFAWSGFDEDVLSLSADGTVTPKSAGTTWAYAVSLANPSVGDSAWIEVIPALPVDSVRFAKRALELYASGAPESLEVKVFPPLANPQVEMLIGETSVAKLSEGKVRGIRDGETWLRVRSVEDPFKTDSIRVSVRPSERVQEVSVSPRTLTLYLGGESKSLEAALQPSSLSPRFLWRSGDPSIAAVDDSGRVSPRAIGFAYVTVVSLADSSRRDSALVVVKRDVPRLKVGPDTVVAAGTTVIHRPETTQEYGLVVAFRWDLDGDGIYEDSAAEMRSPLSHRYATAGEYLARFQVRDTEGNDTTVVRKVTAVDGPVIQFHAPEDGAHVNRTPVLVEWSVDGARQSAQENLVEGRNVITRSAKDAAGNTYSVSLTLHLDTQKPVVDITAPPEGLLTRQSAVAVTWTVDGEPQSTGNLESLGGRQGTLAIVREAVDAAGNRGSDTVRIVRDTVAPAPVTFGAGTSPEIVNAAYSSPVQWSWSRTGAAADSFLVSLNGAPAVMQAGTIYVLSNPTDQTYTLEVGEVDAAGNVSAPATRSIRVDRVAPPAPVVTGTTPAGSASWTWSAANGSDGVRVFRYKLSTAASYSAEGAATSFSPAGLATGGYTLLVQERDAAGNWSADGSFRIEVDADGPNLAILSPTEMGRVVANFNPKVVGVADDIHGIRRIEFRLNSSAFMPVVRSGENWEFASNYGTGLNTIWVRGEDELGNRDSVRLEIFKNPNVIFVRKGANGSGNSWEDAVGELHQVLDYSKRYEAGAEIWVSKGMYKSATPQSRMYILSSNLKILGGFPVDRATYDQTQRDLSIGATVIAGRLELGSSEVNSAGVTHVTLDGFSIKADPGEVALIRSGVTNNHLEFRNIKVSNYKQEETILHVDAYNFLLENCEFIDNYSYQAVMFDLQGTGSMINCRMVNNGSTANYSPVHSLSLKVQGGYFLNNYYDDENHTIAHFSMSSPSQSLTIDGAAIQRGVNGIYREPAGIGDLDYGPNNTTLPDP